MKAVNELVNELMVNELRGRELWLTSSEVANLEVADWVANELRGRGLGGKRAQSWRTELTD